MAFSSKTFSSAALPRIWAAAAALALGCAPAGDAARDAEGAEPASPVAIDFQSYEEFRATVYREPWAGGAYIVEGDIPLADDDALRAYYERQRLGQNALVLGTSDGDDIIWNADARLDLTYCISNTLADGERDTTLRGLRVAAARWEAVADVAFRYVPAEDANCDEKNTRVIFNVTKVTTNDTYFARAFFPNNPRDLRRLNIDANGFAPAQSSNFDDVMTHELGHMLGFRHEHGRPEAVRKQAETCTERSDGWRAFTPYDDKSVMAYPECGGYPPGQFRISRSDELGAQAIYGAPGRQQPIGGETVTYRFDLSGTPTTFDTLNQPLRARAGSVFVAVLKGRTFLDSPNLYVNLDTEAAVGKSICQPPIDFDDMPETCRILIPPGVDRDVWIGYQAGSGGAPRADLGLTVVYMPGN